MIQKISKNGVGLLVLLLALVGLDVDEKLADDITAAVVLLTSFGLMLWNQLSRKDLKWGLLRR